jgi:ELWxxDGT repeat protein
MKINPPIIYLVCLSFMLSGTSGWSQTVQTIKDINTNALEPSPTSNEEMTAVGNRLYLATDDEIVGTELWTLNVAAKLNSPRGLFFYSGRIYLADTDNHVIREINETAGTVRTVLGNAGRSGFANRIGIAAVLSAPRAIAFDTTTNIGTYYVADTANHVIRKVTPNGVVSVFAGTPNTAGFANGSSNTLFNAPEAIVIDGAGNLFVADTGNHVIRRISSAGLVSTFAGGAGVSGSTDSPTGTSARFSSPRGLALRTASSEVFVADTGNHTIRRISGGGAVTTLAGTSGSNGALNGTGAAARFDGPRALVLGSGGNLFVADTGNHSIRQVVADSTVNNGTVTTLAGSGSAGYSNGTGTAAQFNGPSGITADSSGNLYVADTQNQVLRKVSSTGVTTTIAGIPATSGLDDGVANAVGIATTPSVLRDIVAGAGSSLPKNLTALPPPASPVGVLPSLLFTAEDAEGNRDLWKTEGTPGSTVLVQEIPYDLGQGPEKLTSVNGTLYFEGFDTTNGRELWKTDRINNVISRAILVKDNKPGLSGSDIDNLLAVGNDRLIFSADRGTPGSTFGAELFTVVTPSSIITALDVPPSTYDGGAWNFQNLTLFNDKVCFSASGVDSNGDPVGTELFYVGPSTQSSLALVKDIGSGNAGSDPSHLTVSGSQTSGTLFFLASNLDNGTELWSTTSDLNDANTNLVKDIYPNADSSNIENLTPIVVLNGTSASNRVVFTATDGTPVGKELWQSDGTGDGTTLLKDITPPENGGDSVLSNFINIGPNLVVFTQEINGKLTLWRTDGTDNGTVIIEDFVTEPSQPNEPDTPVHFRKPTLVGNTLYFMLGDDQLWKTTGANDASTVRVYRFRQGTAGSGSQSFTQLADGRVAFSAFTGQIGREPWVTDGTPTGTTNLSDLVAGTASSDPQNFTAGTGNQFFFTASPVPGTSELYVVNDVTVSLLQQINSGGDSAVKNLFWNPNSSLSVSPTLYFAANDSMNTPNIELWKSSGAIGSAVKVKEINTALDSSSDPSGFTAIRTTVYFAATDSDKGRELYKTDGTATGTVRVKDINALGINSSDPTELLVGPGGKLFFVATGGSQNDSLQNTGRELWMSDGTDAGTKAVKNINFSNAFAIEPPTTQEPTPAYLTLVGNTLYFVADDGEKGKELWQSNGTEAGTKIVKDINTAQFTGSNPTNLRNASGKLFFMADDGINGRELWTIGATGPVMVNAPSKTGLVTGAGSANIQDLTVVNDVVCFVANDDTLGREVWLSNGTTAGTFIASDFLPGANSSNPSNLFAFGSNLIFSASDNDTGAEPRLAFTAPTIFIEQPVTMTLPKNGSAAVNFTPSQPVPFGTGPSSSVSLTFKIINSGITNLRNVSALRSGLHASEYSITTKPAATIAGSSFSTLVVKFTPKEGGLRVATLRVLSSDPLLPSFVINLSGTCGKETTLTGQPAFLQFVKVGTPVSLSALAVTAPAKPLSLQWRRNGSPVAGGVTNPLLLSAALSNAGLYTAQFTNSTPTTPTGIGTSDPAHLGVVEDFSPARVQGTRLAASSTISVEAASSATTLPLRYQWKRSTLSDLSNAETLVNTTTTIPTKFKNVTTKTLTITGAGAGDGQYYFCEVTDFSNNMLVGGTTLLKVYTDRPSVDDAQVMMPTGIVGRLYTHQITVAAEDSIAPVSYTATGLPPGVSINSKTGLISGRPTKAGTYKVKLNAANLVGNDQTPPAEQTVTILNLPDGLDGTYTGLIDREPNLNGNLGGRIDLTVTKATGAFTGSLTMGALNYKFTGGLDIAISTVPTLAAVPPYNATVTVSRGLILAPLTLTFTINDTTKSHLTNASVSVTTTTGPASAAIQGWKQTRKATPVNESASAYQGLYNFGLKLPAQVNSATNPNLGNVAVPQGNGYGSFTVAAAGTLTFAGRTPDGETLTGGTFVGPAGQVLVYQLLYSTTRRGTLRGQLNLSTGALPADASDNTLTSTNLDWARPANLAVLSSSARTYRAGFGLPDTPVVTPVQLEAFGGRYVVPTTLLRIANPPSATAVPLTANAEVKFTEGGLAANVPSGAGATLNPDINVAVTATNTSVIIGLNAAKTSITPNRTTGAITGRFSLSDLNARTLPPLTPNPILRAVTYQGLIVPDNTAGTHEGVGYFMLPQLPTSNNATLITTAPILSGKMSFKTLP